MDDKGIVGPTLEQLKALEDYIDEIVERHRVLDAIMNSGAAPLTPEPEKPKE